MRLRTNTGQHRAGTACALSLDSNTEPWDLSRRTWFLSSSGKSFRLEEEACPTLCRWNTEGLGPGPSAPDSQAGVLSVDVTVQCGVNDA